MASKPDFSIERKDICDGTPIISVWIEFRNISDNASPLSTPWNGGLDAKFSLTDQHHHDVPMDGLSYDGLDLPLEKIAVPCHSSLRFYASRSGAGIGLNDKAMIDLGPTGAYRIQRGDAHANSLQCTLSAAGPVQNQAQNEWHGVLRIPGMVVVE
jgi:hypothetical protein